MHFVGRLLSRGIAGVHHDGEKTTLLGLYQARTACVSAPNPPSRSVDATDWLTISSNIGLLLLSFDFVSSKRWAGTNQLSSVWPPWPY